MALRGCCRQSYDGRIGGPLTQHAFQIAAAEVALNNSGAVS